MDYCPNTYNVIDQLMEKIKLEQRKKYHIIES